MGCAPSFTQRETRCRHPKRPPRAPVGARRTLGFSARSPGFLVHGTAGHVQSQRLSLCHGKTEDVRTVWKAVSTVCDFNVVTWKGHFRQSVWDTEGSWRFQRLTWESRRGE